MNLRKLFTKLNQSGFGHHIVVPVIAVIAIAAIGVRVLTATHAATSPSMLFELGGKEFISTKGGPATSFTSFTASSSEGIPATFALNGSNIFYFSGTNNDQLYEANSLGQNGKLILTLPTINGGGLYTYITWSETAQKLAIMSEKTSNFNNVIYTVNPDGTGLKKIYSGNQLNPPIWSPDGTNMLFTAPGSNYTLDVFELNVKAKTATQLVKPSRYGCNNPAEMPPYQMVWLSNTSFACVENSENIVTGNPDGYIGGQNIDGSSPTNLYTTSDNNTMDAMALSPDGSQIAFTTSPYVNKAPVNSCNLYVMPSTGSSSPKLIYSNTNSECNEVNWSPDGVHIAFNTYLATGSNGSFSPGLYVITDTGANLTTIKTSSNSNKGAEGLTWSIQ